MLEMSVGKSIQSHIKTFFVANNSDLRITCAGHSDPLGYSIPVTSENTLVKEVENAFISLNSWESIKITNRDGKTVFCLSSSTV